jgi:hypothetical protein
MTKGLYISMPIHIDIMIRKFVKILPYFIVMWFIKKFNGDHIKTDELGMCRGFRIDKGEWVLFSEQNYNRMRERELKEKQTELDKKKAKIHKILDKDYSLKSALKEDFEQEAEREREDFEN